ncbi:hypothetical protein KA005_41670 [bacterium]|nr:hypothetical protein [bacterium]
MAAKKKPGPAKGSGGAPAIVIDWELFAKYCQSQCTEEEIANYFQCSIQTINRKCKEKFGLTFVDTFKKESVGGLCSLRRAQWSKAVDGENATMLIWLGKQFLGQSDKIEQTDKTDYSELMRLAGAKMD